MTAFEDRLYGERLTLWQQAREIRAALGLKPDATHALTIESIRWFVQRGRLPIPDGDDDGLDPEYDFRLGDEFDLDLTEPPGEVSDLPPSADQPIPGANANDLAELRQQLADAQAESEFLRAELDAIVAEQPRDPGRVALFEDVDPSQRPRLALVFGDDPPLEDAQDAMLDAVKQVPGVSRVAVDSLPDEPGVFVVSVTGGESEAIARAILRTFPDRSASTAGTTRVEVDGQVVWLCRPAPT